MSKRTFRQLIVWQWLLALVSVVAWYIELRFIPEVLRNYVEAQGSDLPMADHWLLVLALLIFSLNVIIYIGLYKFKPWSKTLLLPSTIASILICPLFGDVHIATIVSSTLGYISVLIGGGVIFSVFFSPVSEHFRSTNAELP